MKVDLPLREVDEHEAAAAEVTRYGMHHGQRKSCRHGGVHRIAAVFQNPYSRVGRQMMNTNHHRVFCTDWLLMGYCDRIVVGVVGSGILGAHGGESGEADKCSERNGSHHGTR